MCVAHAYTHAPASCTLRVLASLSCSTCAFPSTRCVRRMLIWIVNTLQIAITISFLIINASLKNNDLEHIDAPNWNSHKHARTYCAQSAQCCAFVPMTELYHTRRHTTQRHCCARSLTPCSQWSDIYHKIASKYMLWSV